MFDLPPLPFAYDAFSEILSERALRLHHGRHHAAYLANTNAILAHRGIKVEMLEEALAEAARVGDARLLANAGQALNHAFFWSCMSPRPSRPSGPLAEAVGCALGGLRGLKERFVAEGAGHLGSGWVWLASDRGRLVVVTTHDADTLVGSELVPLLTCDLWEHAYYLDHQADRGGFLEAWWETAAGWDFASAQYRAARDGGKLWTFAEAERGAPVPA